MTDKERFVAYILHRQELRRLMQERYKEIMFYAYWNTPEAVRRRKNGFKPRRSEDITRWGR